MQKLQYFLIIFISVFSLNGYALEPILDQQAYIYFHVPFGGTVKPQNDYSFGFRLDRTLTQPGAVIDLSANYNKPAVFNFKLGRYGIKSFELNGVDYLDDYYVYRGAEGGAKTANETESADPQATETAEAPQQEEEKKGNKISDAISKAPADLTIGVAIGLLVGVVTLVAGAQD